jgi:hypothetical protein
MKGELPWRQGRKVGRTIYDANDELIGVMDTPELAAKVVKAINDVEKESYVGERKADGLRVMAHLEEDST